MSLRWKGQVAKIYPSVASLYYQVALHSVVMLIAPESIWILKRHRKTMINSAKFFKNNIGGFY